MSLRIYHNPRCSKSRQTLELIENAGQQPEIVFYLETPPGAEELHDLVTKLGVKPMDIVRRKEAEFTEAGLSDNSSDEEVIAALVKYPKLLERPIVVKGKKAVVGRPPENVKDLLN